ncbi:MAG: NnrU family protein [Halopseudomonas sp.]
MVELLAAVAVFIVSHMIPMRPRFRQPLEQKLGLPGFLIGYSILSLAIIYWLAQAFANAPYIQLWPWTIQAAWLPVVLMPLACVLIVAGASSKNPFSLGLGGKGYDPKRPGIVSVTRHPLMWGLVIWAGAHIPVNGDAAGLILFALMLILSLAGTLTLERARKRKLGPEQWQRLHQGTVNLPFSAFGRIDWRGIGWLRLLGGLLLYGLLLFAHQAVIGIAPPVFY